MYIGCNQVSVLLEGQHMIYSIEVVTVERRSARSAKLVRKTHRAWTWAGALKWVACYHPTHSWAIGVKRMGRVIALRGVQM